MGTSGDKIVLLDGMGSGSGSAVSVILRDVRGSWNVTSGSLRNVKSTMSGRTRCIARAGSASVRSVTSTIAWILTCVEVVEVVTTEEQTLMTRIISGT